MKKLFTIFALTLCISAISCVSAWAVDAGAISAGAATVAVAEGTREFYEASVIARVIGRAGTGTAKTAKGNVFEVLYADKLNLRSIFSGNKTVLSESSIDTVADLVTTNKQGEIFRLIQCKAGGNSLVSDTIRRVNNGQYEAAELVGTTEFAELYNAKAVGLQQATDSGISTSRASRIANKAFNVTPSAAEVLQCTMKNSAFAATIAACISATEAIYRQEDFATASGNVLTDTGISAVSVAFGTMSQAGITELLTVLGASTVATSITSGVVGIMVPLAVGYALYIIADETEFRNAVSETVQELGIKCADVMGEVNGYLQSLNVKAYAEGVTESLENAWQSGTGFIGNTYSEVRDGMEDCLDQLSGKGAVSNESTVA